jgi:P27 family predicted phage terminase small subunit
MPKWLLKEGKKKWKDLCRQLVTLGVVTRVDGTLLARYCQAWARWVAAEDFMTEHGTVVVVRGDDGQVETSKPVPQFAIATKLAELMKSMEAELGIGASARTRIKVDAPAAAGGLAAFASQKRNA